MSDITIRTINSICILGGGTAGWMCAAALANHFKHAAVAISVVESSSIGTVGVGEATIPTIRRFYNKLGLSDQAVISATKASIKLGIEFQDWSSPGSRFIHPFGIYGQGTKTTPFHHYWLRAKQHGLTSPLSDFSLGVQLAKNDKFALPKQAPQNQLEIFDFALHFDASLFAKLMKDYAIDNGVTWLDTEVTSVNTNAQGDILTLVTSTHQHIGADLFIDCSGFKALLIGQAQGVKYINWDNWLLNDSAVAVQTSAQSNPITRTIAKAKSAGWQWRIPLQHRIGNGYVYSSNFASDHDPYNELLASVEGNIISEPKTFSFCAGRREKAWHQNCVAIGLASGFLEPLESTSIALIETAIEKLLLSLPTPAYNQASINKFNDVNATEYERVRDFIIMHYKLNGRTDNEMWAYYRNMPIPASLADKLAEYKETAELKRLPWEMFGPDSWLALYDGLQFSPTGYHHSANNMPLDYLANHLNHMKKMITQQVNNAISHTEFLTRYCGYTPLNKKELQNETN